MRSTRCGSQHGLDRLPSCPIYSIHLVLMMWDTQAGSWQCFEHVPVCSSIRCYLESCCSGCMWEKGTVTFNVYVERSKVNGFLAKLFFWLSQNRFWIANCILLLVSRSDVLGQCDIAHLRVFVSTGAIYNAWDHHGRESTDIRATVSCQELKLDGILAVFQMAF